MTAQVPPLTSPYGNFLLGSARPQLCPALPTPGDAAPLTLPAGRRSSWQGGGLPMAAHSSRPALSASATKQNGPIALFESFREDEKDLVFFFLTQSYKFVFFSSALIPPHPSPATCTPPPQSMPLLSTRAALLSLCIFNGPSRCSWIPLFAPLQCMQFIS